MRILASMASVSLTSTHEGKVLRTVNDVRVTGFTVRDFSGVGIIFGGTNRSRADHNVAASNKGYGITAFLSTHGTL